MDRDRHRWLSIPALRGPGTLARPVTVGLSAARAVLIPRTLRHLESTGGVRGLVVDTALMTALAMPALTALSFIPDPIGRALLGDTWRLVAPILPLTALELLFQLFAAVPESAHRALGRGGRIVAVRSGSAVVRIPVVVLAALSGLDAVVAAAAVVTMLSATAWWVSLATLSRPDPQPRGAPRFGDLMMEEPMRTLAIIVPEYRTPEARGGGLSAEADFVARAFDGPHLAAADRWHVRFIVPRMYHRAAEHATRSGRPPCSAAPSRDVGPEPSGRPGTSGRSCPRWRRTATARAAP